MTFSTEKMSTTDCCCTDVNCKGHQ